MTITFQGNPLSLKGSQIKVGDNLKNFTCAKNDLSPISLNDTSGVRIFLTLPSLDTPICDTEIKKFSEELKKLPNVSCYAVSYDLPFAQARWCNENNIKNIQTISDYKDKLFSDATGTYINELGLTTRACFVVDSNAKVVYADYLKEITEEPNYFAVIEAAKNAN